MKYNKEFKIGIFVVLTLAASFVLVNFLRGNDFFKGSNTFYSVYTNVEGLNPSGAVYINGFKVGSVSDISYNKKVKKYIVKINMSKDFEIAKDSYTEIYSSDILGGKSIRIVEGVASELASSGDTLSGNTQPDMLTSLLEGVVPLTIQLDTLLKNLNITVGNVNAIIDDGTRNDIKEILSKIEHSMSSIEYITGSVEQSTPELTSLITNLNTLTGQLNTSATTLNQGLDNISSITQELKEAELKETITNLKNLIIQLRDPNGTLGKIMTTDSLHNSINSLASDLDSLVQKIESDPKKYIKISVF